jgi:hypothetical protein
MVLFRRAGSRRVVGKPLNIGLTAIQVLETLLSITECGGVASELVKRWKISVQKLIDKYSEVTVCNVVNWYVKAGKTCYSPQQFIDWFPKLLRNYEVTINPYSVEELKPVMRLLSRLTWGCEESELALIVGRSLFVVRCLQDKLLDKGVGCLDRGVVKFILGRIDNVESFVVTHFETSYGLNLKFVEITAQVMRKYVVTWSCEYGVSPEQLLEYLYGKC